MESHQHPWCVPHNGKCILRWESKVYLEVYLTTQLQPPPRQCMGILSHKLQILCGLDPSRDHERCSPTHWVPLMLFFLHYESFDTWRPESRSKRQFPHPPISLIGISLPWKPIKYTRWICLVKYEPVVRLVVATCTNMCIYRWLLCHGFLLATRRPQT